MELKKIIRALKLYYRKIFNTFDIARQLLYIYYKNKLKILLNYINIIKIFQNVHTLIFTYKTIKCNLPIYTYISLDGDF